jgi:hypothetical protein
MEVNILVRGKFFRCRSLFTLILYKKISFAKLCFKLCVSALKRKGNRKGAKSFTIKKALAY